MSYELLQLLASLLDAAVGIALGVAVVLVSRRYERRTSRKKMLLETYAGLARAFSQVCDARWICRPRPADPERYLQLLIAIGNQRGVFVDARHALRNADLLRGAPLDAARGALDQIDKYLLALLKESTRFDPATGEPSEDPEHLSDIGSATGTHPLYRDFLCEWSTRDAQGLSCTANERLRLPFHRVREILGHAIVEPV